MEVPLPSKSNLKLANTTSKMIITIFCPYCNYIWEVIDDNLDDYSKSDPINIIEQCPQCFKWMKTYDDDVAVDIFYEDYEQTDD